MAKGGTPMTGSMNLRGFLDNIVQDGQLLDFQAPSSKIHDTAALLIHSLAMG